MALLLELNGKKHAFAELAEDASLASVIAALGLQADRVAVEHNGEIVSRTRWAKRTMRAGDKLEVVHFVGGGSVAALALEDARGEDVPAIVALANLAYRGEAGWTTEAGVITGERLTEAGLRDHLQASPEAHLLVWRDAAGATLTGTVWLEPQEQGSWYLGLLTVRPELQNQKRGRTMLAAAEDFARSRGATRMSMTVLSLRGELLAWYGRRGYQPTGEFKPFPYEDERFGRALRAQLHFVVLAKEL